MFSGAIKEALSRFFRIEELMEHISGYVDARVALIKLEVREEVVKTITRVMVMGILVLLGVFVLMFISIGVAFFINQYFTEKYMGFFWVGGFYLLLLTVSIALRKQIYHAFEKILSHQLKHHKD